ncbi:hypothetical protein ASG65_06300 [Bacillus sp. Leaf13]|nr:hypothetical protein ASG65_06300 [Bacillus sp. Leaf13]KRF63395.1 hypothetical protein ASG99_04510 [Bacillus sp. Soil768D1]
MIYEKNKYFVLELENEMIYITVFQKGFSILHLNPILIKFPQILLENFNDLKDTLESKGDGEITIGQMAFPDTRLQIKSLEKKLIELTKGTFYAENNYLHFD